MRKSLTIVLLASASISWGGSAGAQDREERRTARRAAAEAPHIAGRSDAAERRAARSEERVERRIERMRSGAINGSLDAVAVGRADRRDIEQIRAVREQRRGERRLGHEELGSAGRRGPGQLEVRGAPVDSVREWRREEREQRLGSLVNRPGTRRPRVLTPPPAGARPDLPAPPPTLAAKSHSAPWRNSWRNDSRYDWGRWRLRNRALFNLGFYYDPFGWGYRRHSIGWRLWPSYYDINYWMHDPWMWRLPPAYGPYRWVRYWDDALLINIHTGRVVDVVYDFFW